MKRLLALALPAALLATGCSHKTNQTAVVDTATAPLPSAVGNRPWAMPKASAFRMNGDFADRVAVTLNPDGTLAYFPAPSDITPESAPLSLGNGWWLNRQGLGPNSVFTKFTFRDYAALKTAPSPGEIIKAIVPGSEVTVFTLLPWPVSEAQSHLPEIKAFLEKAQTEKPKTLNTL